MLCGWHELVYNQLIIGNMAPEVLNQYGSITNEAHQKTNNTFVSMEGCRKTDIGVFEARLGDDYQQPTKQSINRTNWIILTEFLTVCRDTIQRGFHGQ